MTEPQRPANREAAEEALAVARRKQAEGDDEAALRWATKSQRLFQLEEGDKFLAWLHKFGPGSEAAAAVRRLLEATDHYAALGTGRGPVDPAALKTLYRQLSLAVHPDKNQARDAAPAFQKLSEAYAVLSNPKQKMAYDAELQLRPATRGGHSKQAPHRPQPQQPHRPTPHRPTHRGDGGGGGSGFGPGSATEGGAPRANAELLAEISKLRTQLYELQQCREDLKQMKRREQELQRIVAQLRQQQQSLNETNSKLLDDFGVLRRQLADEQKHAAESARKLRFHEAELAKLRMQNHVQQERLAHVQAELDTERAAGEERRRAVLELGEAPREQLWRRGSKRSCPGADAEEEAGGCSSGDALAAEPPAERAQGADAPELHNGVHQLTATTAEGAASAGPAAEGAGGTRVGQSADVESERGQLELQLKPIGRVDGRKTVKLPLTADASLIFGRSSTKEPNDFCVNDPRVSRRHVRLSVSAASCKASATAIGANAIGVWRVVGGDCVKLTKGHATELGEGDTLQLVMDDAAGSEAGRAAFCLYSVHYAPLSPVERSGTHGGPAASEAAALVDSSGVAGPVPKRSRVLRTAGEGEVGADVKEEAERTVRRNGARAGASDGEEVVDAEASVGDAETGRTLRSAAALHTGSPHGNSGSSGGRQDPSSGETGTTFPADTRAPAHTSGPAGCSASVSSSAGSGPPVGEAASVPMHGSTGSTTTPGERVRESASPGRQTDTSPARGATQDDPILV